MLPDFVYYLASKDRIDIGIIPPFAKVDFYSGRRILLNTVTKSGRFEKGMQLGNTALAWIPPAGPRKIHPCSSVSSVSDVRLHLTIYVMINNF